MGLHGLEAQVPRPWEQSHYWSNQAILLFVITFTVLTHDTVRYGEVRRGLSAAKGRNERTYGLGGAPVVIVHGNQRHELA